jgi:hypothetical protein
VDEKKLKEVFRLAGKVVGVELSRDKEGKSRGFAVVVFDHPVEAVQAISMLNDQQLLNRRITVRFDKVAEEEQPRSLKRLPEGLRGVGMGLGQDGVPLWDVRATLGENMNQGNTLGLSSMATSMAVQQQQQQQPAMLAAAAANVNTQAAIQAALTTILGLAGTAQQQQQQMNMGMNGGGMMGGNGGGMMGNVGGGGMGGGGGMSLERQMDMERAMLLERNMERMSGGGMGGRGGGDMLDMGDRDNMGGGGMMGDMDRGAMMDRRMSSGDMMEERGMAARLGDRAIGGGGMGDRMMDRGMMMDDRSMSMRGGGGGMDMGMSSSRGGGGMSERGMMGMSDRGGMDVGMRTGGGVASGGMKRLSDKVIVKNLPLDCTWQQLKDRFAHAGDIKFAEMKERGVGIVR